MTGLGQDTVTSIQTGVQTSAPSTPSTGIWDTISAGITGASKILSARYAVPQLAPGQYIQQTPQGSVMYQLSPGQSTSLFPGASTLGGASISTVLLIGGVGLAVVLMMRMMSKSRQII